MATIYKLEIKMVSPFCAFTEEEVKETLKEFLKKHKYENGLGFESIEVNVEKIK